MTADPSPGTKVEEYARRLAGDLGVKDFVYDPLTERKGGGTRERSDGLLAIGDRGLILQVKSRDPDKVDVDTPERASSWTRKMVEKAIDQATGTRRALAQPGRVFTSLRGYRRALPSASTWPAVVIIDHPKAPPVDVPRLTDTLFLTLGDWRNLHTLVRSTAAVIEYVERALALNIDVALGNEVDRYSLLATADASIAPDSAGRLIPALPGAYLDAEEAQHVDLFDQLVEVVADSTNEPWDENSYLDIVELLDRQPVLGRCIVGSKLMKAIETTKQGERSGFTAGAPGLSTQLVFLFEQHGTDDVESDTMHQAELAAYAVTRHEQALESGAPTDLVTLGVGVNHSPVHGWRYVYVFLKGDVPKLPAEVRLIVELEHGVHHHAARATAPLLLAPNAPCPCESGAVFAECHGSTV